MKRIVYVSEHIKGFYSLFAVISPGPESRLDYSCPTTFEQLCNEIGLLRRGGYELKNWDSEEIDREEFDPLGTLDPLGREEMSELELKTNPEVPTINDLERMFNEL